MLETKAVFSRKEPDFEPRPCVVEKVIRLSGAEYDSFARNMLRDWNFIRDNPIDTVVDAKGQYHCLLITGDGRRDGILVNSEGYDYARYSAFIPNAEDFLTMNRYPALAALTQRLIGVVDDIAGQIEAVPFGQRSEVDLRDIETRHGIDLLANGILRDAVLDMLADRMDAPDFELNKNELIIYREQDGAEKAAADITDPSVTKMDMYAYGYEWDGMIPLGRERALELFDEGYQIYRLYGDNTEGAVDDRADIEAFDGMFGREDPAWNRAEQEQSGEAFILNSESYDKGEPAGEWIKLSADADVLPDEKPSVVEQIKAARQAPRQPDKDATQKHKNKGDPEL